MRYFLALAESMPLPWQQRMRHLLAKFHQAFGYLEWLVYRLVSSRYERLANLDEAQLVEVGGTAEVGDSEEVEYRTRDGSKIEPPESHQVLVSSRDPIPRPQPGEFQSIPTEPPTGMLIGACLLPHAEA